jgi:hypothetical protein
LALSQQRLHQRAVDGEVIIRQQRRHLPVREDRLQELLGNVGFQQPVAVLGVGRMIPDRVVDAEPDKPAKQQIVIELLHQLALGPDRVERLDQRAAQQSLGCDRGPAEGRVHRRELGIERDQHLVDDLADYAQRVVRRHPLLQINVREQRPRHRIRSAHRRLHP